MTKRIGAVVERVEHGEVALARDAEREVDAVDDELVDEELSAGAAHRRMCACASTCPPEASSSPAASKTRTSAVPGSPASPSPAGSAQAPSGPTASPPSRSSPRRRHAIPCAGPSFDRLTRLRRHPLAAQEVLLPRVEVDVRGELRVVGLPLGQLPAQNRRALAAGLELRPRPCRTTPRSHAGSMPRRRRRRARGSHAAARAPRRARAGPRKRESEVTKRTGSCGRG